MKICLISVEIFAWGKYGGFGRATRIIGLELVKRGHDVYAVVPMQKGQKKYEELDGIKVFAYPKKNPFRAIKHFKTIDADIYHSQEPSLATYFAQLASPRKKHMITFRDTRDLSDWKIEYSEPSVSKLQVFSNFIFENNFFVNKAIKNANRLYCASGFVGDKAKKKYGLRSIPEHLPTPVNIEKQVQKSESPKVCYLGRWDRRKRPELFFMLAERFPEVTFVAIGASRDKKYNDYLHKKYEGIPNLQMRGFVNQFESNETIEVLSNSWVLINTASREGLPNAFIEGLSCKTAILSHVDPDGFSSKYGYHALDNNFEKGLEYLLQNDAWKDHGEKGYDYVREIYEMDKAMGKHEYFYKQLMGVI